MTRPSALWRLAIVPAWITVSVMVLGAGMVGPLILMLVPPLFAGGVGLLSAVHTRASALPECEACGKIALVSAVGPQPGRPSSRPAAAGLARAA